MMKPNAPRMAGTLRSIAMNTAMVLLLAITCASCKEEVDISARYVFSDRTIADYLSAHEQYSEYMKMLDELHVSTVSNTTFRQLFSARGHYTVFAPTNDAIRLFLDDLQKKGLISEASWEGFPDASVRDSIQRVIVFNSVIDSGDDLPCLMTYDFPTTQDAEIMIENMYGRKVVVHYDSLSIQINGSPMDDRNRDIPALNGVIHAMNRVIAPSNNRLGFWLQDILKLRREGFHVAAMLAEKTGLIDTLNALRDETYELLYQQGLFARDANYAASQPEHRKYGYTFFAETDSMWSAAIGKPALDISVEDVMAFLRRSQAYPEATDDTCYTNQDNLLNQFLTYHILPFRLAPGRLVIHRNEYGYSPTTGNLGCAMSEYYYTMGKRRLMKIYESRESNGIYLNRCPILDNGRHGSYHELSCPEGREGVFIGKPDLEGENNLANALVYPIGSFLFYDEQTRRNLGRERIRFDVAAISPEMMNNDIRMNEITDSKHSYYRVAPDMTYPYFKDFRINTETTIFGYYTARTVNWNNYNGDEVNIWGIQDITLTLPPVPVRDTYEIRYGYSIYEYRGIFQIFFGTDLNHLYPAGIPLDMRTAAAKEGWEPDTEDDDYNAEIDKRMRNKGYMKGLNSYSGTAGGTDYARKAEHLGRRIFVRQTLDPDKTYYLRMKSCLDIDRENAQLYMDVMEMCPKSVYDNPETPEDIW